MISNLFVGGLLLVNSGENVLVFLSVSPETPFWYEPSGIQLLYSDTIGLMVYLMAWGLNYWAYTQWGMTKLYLHLPLIFAGMCLMPTVIDITGLLSFPESNQLLFSYGVGLAIIMFPLLLFSLLREISK